MVAINNPFDELQRKLDKAKEDYERLKEITTSGFISERFGEYAGHLMILNHLTDESEVYARLGDINKAGKSLADMKHQLDGVAAVILADGRLETESIGGGLSIVKNPDFNNINRLQPLYDHARSIYDEAVSKCEQILGTVA